MLGDHLCWPFHGPTDLAGVARGYVAEGLARGERVVVLTESNLGDLQEHVVGAERRDAALDRGQLQLATIDPAASAERLPPADDMAALVAMTRDALDAGYPGLRILAIGTVRVTNPVRRARQVRYEHLIDEFCLDHPLIRLCAYDLDVVGEGAVAELACVHTLAHGNLSPFRLHATPRAAAALAGAVDAFSAAHLEQALRHIAVAASPREVVIDATGVEFLDHHALLVLNRHATHTGATIVLRSPPSIVTRLINLLDLHALSSEVRA
jgi:anti-anti-sigma regulatory factor